MLDYRVENSSVLSWIVSKRVSKTRVTSISAEELYAEYCVWCDVNGFKSVRSTRFDTEVCNEYKLDKQDDMFVDKT
jgi:phage/plasmid-associated DNA primase